MQASPLHEWDPIHEPPQPGMKTGLLKLLMQYALVRDGFLDNTWNVRGTFYCNWSSEGASKARPALLLPQVKDLMSATLDFKRNDFRPCIDSV